MAQERQAAFEAMVDARMRAVEFLVDVVDAVLFERRGSWPQRGGGPCDDRDFLRLDRAALARSKRA